MSDVAALLAAFGGPPATKGTVHLVGGGPGDPGLITLRGAVLLASCDVVAYDRLAPQEALEVVPARAERLCVGRRSGEDGPSRAEVDALLVARAQAGLAVVRLKGGDPFVFGRGGEEAAACHAAGVPVEVVSGVTSAVAVPGAAGIPVTHRTVAAGFAVVTGHEDPAKPTGHIDPAALAAFPGTLVFLMGVGNVAALAAALVAHGRSPDTPVALVRWGTTPQQETVEGTLATIADEVARRGLSAPAVTVVGDVVRLRGGIQRRDRLPLAGRRVLLPRTLDRPSQLAGRVRALGGAAVELRVATCTVAAAGELPDPARYRAVVVSSPVAAGLLADAVADSRRLPEVWTVGRGAATVVRERLHVVPDVAVGDLAELPPAEGTLALLPDGSELAGAHVVAAYRLEPVPDLQVPPVDLVALASSTAAEALAGHDLAAVTMGPRTTAAARRAGLRVLAEADEASADGLVDAVVAALAHAPEEVAR